MCNYNLDIRLYPDLYRYIDNIIITNNKYTRIENLKIFGG